MLAAHAHFCWFSKQAYYCTLTEGFSYRLNYTHSQSLCLSPSHEHTHTHTHTHTHRVALTTSPSMTCALSWPTPPYFLCLIALLPSTTSFLTHPVRQPSMPVSRDKLTLWAKWTGTPQLIWEVRVQDAGENTTGLGTRPLHTWGSDSEPTTNDYRVQCLSSIKST